MKEDTSKRLNRILKEKGLRQVDLLEMCEPYCKKYNVKLSRSDLSQYITGKVKPRQDKLTVMALALGVTEGWLMGYEVDKNRSYSNEPIYIGQDYSKMMQRFLVEVHDTNFSDEEMTELISYANYLIAKRGK